jgi:two-component system chemotaxis response regulator CheB
VIRHLIRQALGSEPDIEIVGAEANGRAALARIPEVKPDVVTLDIEMPEMDGIETLRRIRSLHPRLRTIMFSTQTTRGASITLEALSIGADDYVAKAANAGSLDRSMESLRGELLPKIRQFFAPPRTQPVAPRTEAGAPMRIRPGWKPRVVAIAVSTGGPQALSVLVPSLPADFPLPVVIVQHMPETFTRLLAERLDSMGSLRVTEASDGNELVAGHVLLARGNHHLRIQRNGARNVAVLDQSAPVHSCRPAADVLFRSLVHVYHGDVLAVVLTGMGQDGLEGVRTLKSEGARTVVQDMKTSVVWGMPGAVASAGLADHVVPLDAMASEIVRLARL